MAVVASEVRPQRCCRCGSEHAAAWYPLRHRGIAFCGPCYSEAIMAGVHIGRPFVPVPV